MEEFSIRKEKFTGTPEQIERQWYEQVYRGDAMRQLTVRAVLTGAILGSILSLTNLYIGLKSGWGFGVTLTACILSYTLWTAFQKMGWVKEPMTILENNCMQSTASSSGYSTGSTLVSAFAALVMIHGKSMDTWLMLCWVFFMAVLGVTMAIPMKRQMINVEQLAFPTGTAAAETLVAFIVTTLEFTLHRMLLWGSFLGGIRLLSIPRMARSWRKSLMKAFLSLIESKLALLAIFS